MFPQQPQLISFYLKTEFASFSVIFRLLLVDLINGAELLHGVKEKFGILMVKKMLGLDRRADADDLKMEEGVRRSYWPGH